MINNIYNIGVDIGSTTIKCVVTDSDGEVIYKSYKRHNAQLTLAVSTFLEDLISAKGNLNVYIAFTGSGAVGLTQRTKLTFVQEVVAASECVRNLYPDARTLLDIGGEDAKLVLFEKDKSPDIRMNGSCAGGTGAFIDQMATLMNISIGEMNEMAIRSTSIYPIASRCAVFAKTDVQNLLSRKVPAEDIAASLFYAVGVQVVNSLARGSMIRPQIIFCGGPLKYISCLRNTFVNILKLKESDVIFPEDAELFTAKGASLIARAKSGVMSLSDIQNHIKSYLNRDSSSSSLLKPLFF